MEYVDHSSEPLPQGWTAFSTPDGLVYYHNAEHNLTKWERPTTTDINSQNTIDLASVTTTPSFLVSTTRNTPPSGNVGSSQRDPEALVDDRLTSVAADYQASARHYFNISIEELIQRLVCALIPKGSEPVMDTFATKPDLYGPVWICFTLAIVQFISSHLYTWCSNKSLYPSYGMINVGIMLTLGWWAVIPLCMRILAIALECPSTLIKHDHLACIYGYSLLTLIPACFLCIVPSKLIQYILVAGSMTLSLAFMARAFKKTLNEVNGRTKLLLYGAAVIGHFVYFMLVPMYFVTIQSRDS